MEFISEEEFSVTDIEAILLKIHSFENHIAEEKAKHDQTVTFYQRFIDNAKTNFDNATKDDRAEIELLKHKLQVYFDANPPKGRKSLKFAGGSFGYNKAQTKFFFNGNELNADNKDFLKLCTRPEFARFAKVKEYLDWAALKKSLEFNDEDAVVFADTGEIIDGLRAQKSFSVKTL